MDFIKLGFLKYLKLYKKLDRNDRDDLFEAYKNGFLDGQDDIIDTLQYELKLKRQSKKENLKCQMK